MNQQNQQNQENQAIALIEEMASDKRLAGTFHSRRTNMELKFKTECHHALEIVKGSKKLAQAIPETIQECIMDVSLLGLTLAPSAQHAYLVPRFIRGKGMVATLYTSWRGLTVAAKRWGGLTDFSAQVVYANEPFAITQGTSPEVRHEIIPNAERRGDLVGAYCIAYMQTGIVKVEYMDRAQIDRAKAVSESKDSQYSPWKNWYEEMARKTVVRRAAKHWQGAPELEASLQVQNKYEGIGHAVADDDQVLLPASQGHELITEDNALALHAMLTENGCNADKVISRICRVMGVESIEQITKQRLEEAHAYAKTAIDAVQRKAG
jgi:phage RecT family recombinase